MAETMKAAVMTGNNRVEIVQRPRPGPGDGEVLVKIEYVGVCGSDIHLFERAWGGQITKPFVLGHEAAGTVVELGPDVTGLAVGDRVALEPGRTCGKCEFCKSGRYNLCPEVRFFSAPPVEGAFQEYVAHEAALCFPLPASVSTLEGALVEPLAVGMHAAAQAGARPGQTAVVAGAGCIGLVSMMALRIRGVAKIIAVDVLDNRLEKAAELGADATVNAAAEDLAEAVSRLTGGCGADIVIDAAGSEESVRAAIRYCKKGATIVLVGYAHSGEMTLPTTLAADKELIFKTVFRYRNLYPVAINSVAAGLADLKSIVSAVYELDDIQQGLEASVRDKATLVKTVIHIG